MAPVMHKDLSEGELIRRYLEGDQAAFGHLVRRHQERVFGFLLGMVRDRNVANDLFQDTWLHVISALNRQRGSYVHTGRFVYWVIRIARNAALDHFRRRDRWMDNGTDETYWDRLPDKALLPDAALSMSEDLQLLEQSIARLPDSQREVVLMRQEGLSFREIAEMTGVSINTALGRMRYALINLRKMMRCDEPLPVQSTASTG